MLMRIILMLVGSGLLANPSLAESLQSDARRIHFEEYLRIVEESHPEKGIDADGLSRSKTMEERQGRLADPELSIGRSEVPFQDRFQPEPEMAKEEKDRAMWQLQLSQRFPWPGTLDAQRRIGQRKSSGIELSNRLSTQTRRFEAIELYLRMIAIDKILTLEKANSKIVSGLRDFAQERFKQGVGSHHEFLQAHSEAGLASMNVASLEVDLSNLKRHASLLMNLQTGVSDPTSVTFDLEWPQDMYSRGHERKEDSKDFVRLTIENRREVDLARRDAERRQSLPSFMASGMLMEDDSGMRMYGGMLGFSLPLFSVAERRALESEGEIIKKQTDQSLGWHDRRKELALLQAESRIQQIQRNEEAVERDIIPPVREHAEALTRQFGQGKAEIRQIVEARRTLLNLEMTRVQTMEALGQAYLSLEKIRSGMIDDFLDATVPRLYGSSNFMNMPSSSMETMPSEKSMKGDSMKSAEPMNPKGPQAQLPEPEDDRDQSGTPGMGM